MDKENFQDDIDRIFGDDEFSFKPVTKGLGFHHDQKTNSIPTLKSHQNTQNRFHGQTQTRSGVPSSISTSEQAVPSGLEAFYGTTTSTQEVETPIQRKRTKSTKRKERIQLAKVEESLLAWGIDSLLLVAINVALHGLFFIVSGLSVAQGKALLTAEYFQVFSAILFAVLYLSYFTIFDLGQTLGKGLVGIEVKSTTNSDLRMLQVFTRVVVTMTSTVLLFFPVLMDFHGKLSETQLVKK